MSYETVLVKLNGNKQYEAHLEEVVYPDRSYGQFEGGAIYWIEQIDKDLFISRTGEVYEYGTDHQIGICPEIQNDYEMQLEKEGEF